MKDNQMLEADIKALRDDLARFRDDFDGIKTLRPELADMVAAWKTASGLARFVKWFASIATAVGVLWVMVKGGG
jgi:putative heme iron utilization protein